MFASPHIAPAQVLSFRLGVQTCNANQSTPELFFRPIGLVGAGGHLPYEGKAGIVYGIRIWVAECQICPCPLFKHAARRHTSLLRCITRRPHSKPWPHPSSVAMGGAAIRRVASMCEGGQRAPPRTVPYYPPTPSAITRLPKAHLSYG